ncbi:MULTISPECIES: glycosyltransferase family 2 protein [Aphanothece]|uniref:glycosyltransferase family 2 protein n=1 Tax=Aphanothece TaxID=1121 RepID=UPI00398F81BC
MSSTRGLIASDFTCTLKHLQGTSLKALTRHRAAPALIVIASSELKKVRNGSAHLNALMLYGSNGGDWQRKILVSNTEVCERIVLEPKEQLFRDRRSMVATISREEDMLKLSAPALKVSRESQKDSPARKLITNIFFHAKDSSSSELFYLVSVGPQHIADIVIAQCREALNRLHANPSCNHNMDNASPCGLHLREEYETHDPAFLSVVYNRNRWRLGETATAVKPNLANKEELLKAGPEYDYLSADGWTKSSSPQGLTNTIAYLSRVQAKPSKGAAILATARNEAVYLPSWCAYHIALGFEKIFLYTNSNDDKTLEVAKRLNNLGVNISVIENQIEAPGSPPQIKAYRHALSISQEILDYKWCAAIDIDEYIAIRPTKRIACINSWLRKVSRNSMLECDIIAMNWIFAGIDKDFDAHHRCLVPITERIQSVTAKNSSIKCIFKPRYFLCSLPHHPLATMQYTPFAVNSEGGLYGEYQTARVPSVSEFPAFNDAAVMHYYHKSGPEYIWKKSRTGGARKISSPNPNGEALKSLVAAADSRHDKSIDWINSIQSSEAYCNLLSAFAEDKPLQQLLVDSMNVMASKYEDWIDSQDE